MSAGYLEAIIGCLGEPVFVEDHQGRFVFVNDEMCELLGRAREELLGRPAYGFFPKEQADVIRAHDRRVLTTGEKDVNEEEITCMGCDTRTIVTTKTLYVDEVGEKYIIATTRDISNHKRTEQAALESEEKFRLLFERSMDPLLLLDGEAIIDCNDAAVRLMGCADKSALIGIRPLDLSPDRQPDGRLSSEKSRELLDATLARGTNRFDWLIRNFQGLDVWIDVSATVVPIPAGVSSTPCCGTSRRRSGSRRR
jgi:PAS domain S-box-containing protein